MYTGVTDVLPWCVTVCHRNVTEMSCVMSQKTYMVSDDVIPGISCWIPEEYFHSIPCFMSQFMMGMGVFMMGMGVAWE
jgi:hypothetical protein